MLTEGDLQRSQRRLESRGKELAERARQKVGGAAAGRRCRLVALQHNVLLEGHARSGADCTLAGLLIGRRRRRSGCWRRGKRHGRRSERRRRGGAASRRPPQKRRWAGLLAAQQH